MDDLDDDHFEAPDLVQLLAGEAGRLIEDVAGNVALTLPADSEGRSAKLVAVHGVLDGAARLIKAALALERLSRAS